MSDKAQESAQGRKRGSGVGLVYTLLRDEILNLTLRPGTPIDEVQLAERFNMSRTPVREAIVRLAGEGLIVTFPNRSTMVANIDLININNFFDALLLAYRVTTQLAGKNHNADDLRIIRKYQVQYREAVESQDALTMIGVNVALHLAIAEAGGNPYFTGFTKRVMDDGRRILRLYYQSYGDRLPHRYADEHDALIDAIENRDLPLCDSLARQHADQIIQQVQKQLVRNDRLEIDL